MQSFLNSPVTDNLFVVCLCADITTDSLLLCPFRAAASSGSSTLNPTAGATMLAQQGGVVFAPTVTGSSTAPMNINFYQK